MNRPPRTDLHEQTFTLRGRQKGGEVVDVHGNAHAGLQEGMMMTGDKSGGRTGTIGNQVGGRTSTTENAAGGERQQSTTRGNHENGAATNLLCRIIIWPKNCLAEQLFSQTIVQLKNCSAEYTLNRR